MLPAAAFPRFVWAGDARLVFAYSSMLRIVDEDTCEAKGGSDGAPTDGAHDAPGTPTSRGLLFVDFIEAIGRVADTKSVGSYARDVPLSWKLRLLVPRILQSQSTYVVEALERKEVHAMKSASLSKEKAVQRRATVFSGSVIPPERGRHEIDAH